MPYINRDRKDQISGFPIDPRDSEGVHEPFEAGELNYALTREIIRYVDTLNYKNINDIIGALECAKLEFYRRVAVPYEERKIDANGDVYPSELTRKFPD